MEAWIADNWFNLLSAVGIIGSLLFTAVSLRSETKTRRIANLLTLTQNHRAIWAELFEHPALGRVLDPAADPSKKPISLEEGFYTNLVVQHLSSAFQAMQSGLAIEPEGVTKDVGWFFSLPIPAAIWAVMKPLQNDDFVEFIERCLKGAGISPISSREAATPAGDSSVDDAVREL